MNLDCFIELSNMQLQLNQRIGRDTKNDPNRINWIFDFCIALEDEINELKNCVNWKWWSKEGKEFKQYTKIIDLENAKIEAIDCLHFILCLDHLVDNEALNRIIENSNSEFVYSGCSNRGDLLFRNCINIKSIISDIIKSNTDYYLLRSKFPELIICKSNTDLENNIFVIFSYLLIIFKILDLEIEDVYNIYKLKNEKNFKRQDANYSVLTKTEDDNNEIKNIIK